MWNNNGVMVQKQLSCVLTSAVCAKNYWAHWPFGPMASTGLLAQPGFTGPNNWHNTMSTIFPQASRASGRALFTGPIRNWLANVVGPVLISQTASVTLTFDLWPWPFAWTSLLSLVNTSENIMMIPWWKHSEKVVTDGKTDRRTDGLNHS